MPTESGPLLLTASMIFCASRVMAASQVMRSQPPALLRLSGYTARSATRRSLLSCVLYSYTPLTHTRPALVGCLSLPLTATALPAAFTPILRPQPTEQYPHTEVTHWVTLLKASSAR